jgi:hypothetical protein
MSLEEEREQLERYKDQLAKEMEGANKRIEALSRCAG